MTKPSLLQIDTLDDRREIWHLLHRLRPDRRLAFMDWACAQVHAPGGTRPIVSRFRMAAVIAESWRCSQADERLTNLLYGDLLLLGSQWGIDLTAAAVKLEQAAKRPHEPLFAAPCTSAAGPIRSPGSSGSALRPAPHFAKSR